ncbi:reverse transcriptase-like protein [Elysia marginata]|uniref:Reverse transcriptase-like protein n=1 Tax=Elysia marginata TaxID=1093978 RepID=A0AAV4FHK3_9GAST|nr:reverse transcriptase-like protein [Elysia marginata]
MSGKAHTVILPAPFPVNELPDRFGAFFQEKVNTIRASIDSCKTDRSPEHEPFLGNSFETFKSVSEKEVKDLITSSSPKSCDLDPLPTTVLLKHLDPLSSVITKIIKDSLTSGIVPNSFKQ